MRLESSESKIELQLYYKLLQLSYCSEFSELYEAVEEYEDENTHSTWFVSFLLQMKIVMFNLQPRGLKTIFTKSQNNQIESSFQIPNSDI